MWLLRFSMICVVVFFFFFFKQKTAYEMRISDWSSDVCSSDLQQESENCEKDRCEIHFSSIAKGYTNQAETLQHFMTLAQVRADYRRGLAPGRSEEHTSELQSLMRISYAVFCLKKKKRKQTKATDPLQQTYTRKDVDITHLTHNL